MDFTEHLDSARLAEITEEWPFYYEQFERTHPHITTYERVRRTALVMQAYGIISPVEIPLVADHMRDAIIS